MGYHRTQNGWNVFFPTFRSDNSIKNHFYSLLRRSLRKLNGVLQREHIKEIKDFKPPILYRIVEVADERSKQQLEVEHNFAEFAHRSSFLT